MSDYIKLFDAWTLEPYHRASNIYALIAPDGTAIASGISRADAEKFARALHDEIEKAQARFR